MIGPLPSLPTFSAREMGAWSWEHLSEADKEQLVSINNTLFHLLSPLAEVTSRIALDDLLRTRISRFRQLKTEMLELLWSTLEELKGQASSLNDFAREATLNKADLLGEEATQQLLGVIDSDEGLTEWAIKASEQAHQEFTA